MLGIGFTLGHAALHRQVGDMTAAPGPAPAFLPVLGTLGAAYHSVHANARLLPSHAGPLVQAGEDLGTGDAAVSAAEVQVMRGTAEGLRTGGWFDQSGNDRMLVSTDADEFPALREDVAIGGVMAMIFDGIRGGDGRGARARRVTADTMLTANNCTLALVIDPTVSVQSQYYFELRNAADTATAIGLSHYPGALFGGVLPDIHGNLRVNGADCGRKIATVPQAIVLRCTPTGTDVFIDGAKIAALPPHAAEATGTLTIGALASTAGLEDFIPTFRLGAFVTIDRGVDDADVAAITAALMQRFGIPATYDAVVVNIGSSRVAGMSQSTLTRNKAWFERAHYGERRIRTYNLGGDGKAISTCLAQRAVFDAEIHALDPALPHVFVIDDPINDLGGLGASTDPVAIYASYAEYRAALTAMSPGVKVVFATCLPQASDVYAGRGRSDAAVEADRVALNAAIRDNLAGADAISDPASSPEMGVYPASPNIADHYPDKLHPSSIGYELLGKYNPETVGRLF